MIIKFDRTYVLNSYFNSEKLKFKKKFTCSSLSVKLHLHEMQKNLSDTVKFLIDSKSIFQIKIITYLISELNDS